MLTVSDTAYAIAQVRADEHALPIEERLFDDPYASIFAAAGAHAAEGTKRFLDLPFFRDGIRLRTRFIDDVVTRALEDGVTQVVLLGAGFDARAHRLREIAKRGARTFENDFGAVLDKKRELLAAANVSVGANVAYVACDFNAPDFDVALAADLAASNFRSDVRAVFVWEGVIAYLDDAAIDRTLSFVARSSAPGSRIVLEHGMGRFDPEGLAARAHRNGFAACEETSFDVLWRRYLPGAPHESAPWVRAAVVTV